VIRLEHDRTQIRPRSRCPNGHPSSTDLFRNPRYRGMWVLYRIAILAAALEVARATSMGVLGRQGRAGPL
jgi:hypothetical protein